MGNEKKLPYDDTSPKDIFRYSQKLLGHSFVAWVRNDMAAQVLFKRQVKRYAVGQLLQVLICHVRNQIAANTEEY